MIRLLIVLILLGAPLVFAEAIDSSDFKSLEGRVEEIERKQSNLDREVTSENQNLERRMDELEDNAAAGGVGLFVSGILCALWAQYTQRSAWLWFFFGLILAPVALIVMVWKNALGLASGDLTYWTRK